MKKILIINGHPDKESFCTALSKSYERGAKNTGATCKLIHLADLKFNPILHHGYRMRTDWEPDLMATFKEIEAADHLVFVYPVWWANLPALLKGFIDRVFLPGYAFESKSDSFYYKKLLKGKTARLIVTMDAPVWYFNRFAGKPGITAMKKGTLEFCGVKPVKVTSFGMMKVCDAKRRDKMLAEAERLGTVLK